MPPGPKPQPTALRALHGDPQQRGRRVMAALKAIEPPPPGSADLGAPPDLTQAQRELWEHAVRHAPLNVLRTIDTWVLRGFVVAADLHRQASTHLQAGVMVPAGKAETTQLVQSPWVAVLNRQVLVMLRAAEQLGFSPASRPRLVGAGALPVQQQEWPKWPGGRKPKNRVIPLGEYLANAPKR